MKTIDINTPSDYEEVCDDILSDFVDYLVEEGFVTYEHSYEEFDYILSYKGSVLFDSYMSKLYRLGERKFPGETLDIYCSNIKWF